MEPDDLTEVYSTNNANEAEIIHAALLAEGIPCQINGEGQAGLAGLGTMEISIDVRASDYDRARDFIEQHLERDESE